MKIKIIDKTYEEVMSLPRKKHSKPVRPSLFFRTLMKVISMPDLRKTHFKSEKIGMEKLGKKESALFLMNHSCFIDLEIVPALLYPRPFNIVSTSDAFIGKSLLMRLIGCIPTHKFVADTSLVRDMMYTLKKNNSSVVLFPEAGYSIDGRTTVLPDNMGKLVKMLGVPVVMITTYGAFARDPLYNNLQVRDVDVSATEKYLLSPDEIAKMSPDEIQKIIEEEFSFDNFKWQRENKIKIDEDFRADYLNRVLYKCPACGVEGKMVGRGCEIKCEACGKTYVLDEYGSLKATEGVTEFDHVPDWYDFEREAVRAELLAGEYSLDVPVDICMTVSGYPKLYRVGEGVLHHDKNGFVLEGCGGKLHYEQKPLASYSLNSDFNWYEIGDVLSIGNLDHLFYCFPKGGADVVAKARLATEELFKIIKTEKSSESKNRENK